MAHITVYVKQGCGTYLVAHRGVRASCTAGAEQAVQHLAKKLYSPKVQIRVEHAGSNAWRIHIPEAN